MTVSDDRGDIRHSRWIVRLLGARFMLGAAAVVLLTFLAFGSLSLTQVLIGLAIIAAAALIGEVGARPDTALPTADRTAAPTSDPLLEAVISGLPDPVVLLDRDGRVVAFNSRAAAIAPALRRGEPASLALRMPDVVEAIRGAISTGKSQRVEFYERVPVDRWSEALVAPTMFEAPANNLVVLTIHDLSPIKRVEEMRADFVANASHELRTPLAALSGFIETLQGPAREDAAARERFLGIMHTQATRMARLIDDLLSLSRIELNAHLRPDTKVDLVPIVRQVADGLEGLARDRDVTIAVEAPAEPVHVLGDRDELIRLFENLIENALKYGAEGKRVNITVARMDGEARVAVRDYGPGIAAEHLPRLTERFYRVDVGESRAQGGTGLGLALVKHILNRHGGRLGIESRVGEGATFTVRLPLSASTAAAA
jgi:two-component system, OmpR family, phosphate regulon sensor histidine kinase PhoR